MLLRLFIIRNANLRFNNLLKKIKQMIIFNHPHTHHNSDVHFGQGNQWPFAFIFPVAFFFSVISLFSYLLALLRLLPL